MKLTREWLLDQTRHGAPNAAQLLVLGIKWPPPSGWMRQLIGREISGEVAEEYILAAQNVRARKKFLPQHAQETKQDWKFCPHCGKSLER